jgi:HAD superfamily hydrolase (TIGR01509 family)
MARNRFFFCLFLSNLSCRAGLIKSRFRVRVTGVQENHVSRLTIFDCDGTLIDSERLVAKVCLQAIHGLGMSDWTMEKYYASFVGMPGQVGWSKVSEELGRPLPEGLNEDVDAQIAHLMKTELVVLPGVREAVTRIGGERCVASSTPKEHLLTNMRYAALDDLFGPHIFSASQVRRAKPAPDVFLFSASQMGFDPRDCVVIEDSVPGVLAARRAGMRVIGYTGAAHDPKAMRQKLLESGADDVVAHMDYLPEALQFS